MGNSDARLRMPALTLEYQVFIPLKEILKLNINQYGQDAQILSQKTGALVEVKMDEIRKAVLAFRLADGYTPKSKLAGTESLMQLMQLVTQSPILGQYYGPALPGIFGHLAQLTGVRGLEEYMPNQQQAMQNRGDSLMQEAQATATANAQAQPLV